jgi:hypothetical protein
MLSVSQPAQPSTLASALIGAGIVGAAAGAGALVGQHDKSVEAVTPGAIVLPHEQVMTAGVASMLAGAGGALVALASKKYRKPAIATAAFGALGMLAAKIYLRRAS